MSGDFVKVRTAHNVWSAIHTSHCDELAVFASFSDPTGTFNGGPGEEGRMETGYGIKGTDYPILWARTTWRIDPTDSHARHDEKHEYWLCIAKAGDEA
jgi:hypothetical protein